MIYTRHNYLNKNFEFIVSNEIIEYDIKSAGFNLIKKFKLVDDDKINSLEKLDKKQRQIQIGLLMRKDKELIKQLNDKFIEVRKWFFEANELEDDDILSIKKDAIISFKRCKNLQFDNIKFIEKNEYTSYYLLNKYEFYFNKKTIDVKGISDDLLYLHEEYMLDFLQGLFKMMETSSKKSCIKLLKEFAYYYKNKDLQIGYYRELNTRSLFKLKEGLFEYDLGIHDLNDKEMVEINYNYLGYVIPLISILV